MRYAVKVTATGEVRDSDGNLISSTPIESTEHFTEAELVAAGLPVPQNESS